MTQLTAVIRVIMTVICLFTMYCLSGRIKLIFRMTRVPSNTTTTYHNLLHLLLLLFYKDWALGSSEIAANSALFSLLSNGTIIHSTSPLPLWWWFIWSTRWLHDSGEAEDAIAYLPLALAKDVPLFYVHTHNKLKNAFAHLPLTITYFVLNWHTFDLQ